MNKLRLGIIVLIGCLVVLSLSLVHNWDRPDVFKVDSVESPVSTSTEKINDSVPFESQLISKQTPLPAIKKIAIQGCSETSDGDSEVIPSNSVSLTDKFAKEPWYSDAPYDDLKESYEALIVDAKSGSNRLGDLWELALTLSKKDCPGWTNLSDKRGKGTDQFKKAMVLYALIRNQYDPNELRVIDSTLRIFSLSRIFHKGDKREIIRECTNIINKPFNEIVDQTRPHENKPFSESQLNQFRTLANKRNSLIRGANNEDSFPEDPLIQKCEDTYALQIFG